MLTEESKETIVIDLDECHAARALEPEQIIHQFALKDFIARVDATLGKGKHYKPKDLCDLTEHFHETIMLNGSRGSGKTTLVLSIFNLLSRQKRFVSGDVYPLGIIDPTLFDHPDIKNRIFLDVVSRIKSAVDDRKRHHQFPHDKKTGDKTSYDIWLEKLQKLAVGLTQLDKIDNNKMWDDPHMLLQEGLKNIKHGRELEFALHQFVEESINYLEVDAFIVAFDDIDTSFKCGWPVLEVIRKYLTTPHLITVLCGDFELYSKLVRKEQWEMFGSLVKTYEKPDEKNNKYEDEVSGLEDQYLTKILKPLNRIRLYPIQHYLEHYDVVVVSGNIKDDISDILNRVCTNVLVTTMKSDSDALSVGRYTREIVRLLQTIPLRSVVSLLNEAKILYRDAPPTDDDRLRVLRAVTDVFMPTLLRYEYGFDEISETSTSMALKKLVINLCRLDMLEDGYKLRGQYWDTDKNKLMLVLGAYYSRYLANNPNGNIDYFILVGLTREMRIQWPLQMATDLSRSELINKYINFAGIHSAENSLQTARKFIAFFRSENTRRSISTGTLRLYPEEIQSSNFNPLWQEMFGMNSKEILRALRGARLTKNHVPNISEQRVLKAINRNRHQKNKKLKMLGKLDYSWRFLVKNWQTDQQKSKPRFNNIDLVFQNYFNTVRTLERAVTSFHRYFITNIVSINMSASGEFLPFVSIFNLLGVVSLILSSRDEKAIMHNIYKYSQIKVYPTYHTGNEPDIELGVLEWGKYNHLYYYELDGVQEENIVTGLKSFCDLLEKWRKKSDILKDKPITVDLLARAWSRFYSALNYMDNVLPDNDLMVGNVLHRMIISFLNSILVELQLDNEPGYIRINIRQPILRDNVFEENLEVLFGKEYCKLNISGSPVESKETSDQSCYTLFRYLFACPLWGLYLCTRDTNSDDENKVFNIYKRHLSEYLNSELKDLENIFAVDYFEDEKIFRNLFTPLNSIAVMKRTPTVDMEGNIFKLISKYKSTIRTMLNDFDANELLDINNDNIKEFIDKFIINISPEIAAPITLSEQEKGQVAAKIRSIISMYVDSDELI